MENKPKYHILLIEPSQIVRQGLTSLIESGNEFIVSSAISDLSHYKSYNKALFDIIIVNTSIVNYDRRTNIRALLDLKSISAVLAISYSPYEDGVMHQYDGVICIFDTKDQIKKKLRQALDNIVQTPIQESKELSAREKEILVAIAQGKSNKEIADEFHLSIHTVTTHRKNISAKLGINTISGLTVYAILNRMIDITSLS